MEKVISELEAQQLVEKDNRPNYALTNTSRNIPMQRALGYAQAKILYPWIGVAN